MLSIYGHFMYRQNGYCDLSLMNDEILIGCSWDHLMYHNLPSKSDTYIIMNL